MSGALDSSYYDDLQDAQAQRMSAPPALATPAGIVEGLLFAWMPLYLLLMQKRVYAQGWTMTLLKYCVLGICYVVLLSLGVAFTMLVSLVWA